MTDQCAYERDGQWDVHHLKEDCRSLRVDVDSLLAELNDLKHIVRVLRDRIDANEMAGSR